MRRRTWLLPWLKADRAVRGFLNSIGLTTKLSLMMLFLTLLSLVASYLINLQSEKAFLQKVEDNITDLSTAIQISVDELTSTEPSNEARLAAYVKKLKSKGVKEISIISNEQEVIASSNPRRIGSKINPKHKDLFITARLGEEPVRTEDPQKEYNLLVPIVVEGEQQGYAHIVLHMDDYRSFFESNHLKRLAITLLIFMIGIGVSIFLSMKYTKPIYEVVSAARKVASGDLSRTLPERRRDEIGDLIRSFNEVVLKLRQERELEERLRKAEQLSTIGQMAAGIAHEIRNPLNFISLSIDHLRSRMSEWSEAKREGAQAEVEELTTEIKREIFRLNQMIENFLKYGKPLRISPCEVDFASLISEVIRLIRHKAVEQGVKVSFRVGEAYQTEENVPPTPPAKILVDPEQMKTCLMNVVLNAMEAMPEGGNLEVVYRLEGDGRQAAVSFSDTGCGMEPEELKKIFKPFFTTKKLGVGLGLALTNRIIEEHGGSIRVKSSQGKGTVVTFYLPVSSVGAAEGVLSGRGSGDVG
ncbi:MAG TPA: ATP-binding protein [Nitrospiria bacterium]|nr:ATP-binding protein [Nitrospiria bacterium]